jgi:hypothetical protein
MVSFVQAGQFDADSTAGVDRPPGAEPRSPRASCSRRPAAGDVGRRLLPVHAPAVGVLPGPKFIFHMNHDFTKLFFVALIIQKKLYNFLNLPKKFT